ncbi:MAG: TRM11 family SAM-dependent methyltransferase [Acidimicrobiales bacterium]
MIGRPDRTESEGFSTDADRKKRLGQYFTGIRLARLLSTLADAKKAGSIVDPMGGTGDMLVGCLELGARPHSVAVIEIDPRAGIECERRMQLLDDVAATVLVGDAFDPETLNLLPTRSWDLVITNPPYVRYQSTARPAGTTTRLPSALQIRQRLIESIDSAPALDELDVRLMHDLAAGYSGLADIAVPSWLLCASLVRPGGMLAMVVPEAWLSRDYASPIQYLLARSFSVEFVVEDADAAWFSDALVKTTLVVARRVPRRSSAFAPDGTDGYLHLGVSGDAMDDRSVVGAAFPRASDPDAAFLRKARSLRHSSSIVRNRFVEARWVPANHTAAELLHRARKSKWFAAVEPIRHAHIETTRGRIEAAPPLSLGALIEGQSSEFVTLDTLGWTVGQGLRTGANQFFYATIEREAERQHTAVVRVSDALGGELVHVPAAALFPVVRKQSDVPDGFVIDSTDVRGRVLVLEHFIHPNDRGSASNPSLRALLRSVYVPMNQSLADYVLMAAHADFGDDTIPRYLSGLSAVVTNVRKYDSGRPTVPPRYWYHLPALAPRHRPLVFTPRVNGSHPRAILNSGQMAVVDANFSTFWPTADDALDAHALLALLNSSWCAASFELIGTVLGGGALKLEATQLRRLALPRLNKGTLTSLADLGHELVSLSVSDARECIDRIDLAIARQMLEAATASDLVTGLRAIASERLQVRTR